MTGAEIMAVVGFIVMLFGAIFGVWKYIDGKLIAVNTRVDAAVNLAAMARSDLADYKLHVSETFATKAGMQEQTSQLLRAIEGVGSRIDGLGERIDNIILNQQKSPTRRQ